MLQLINYLGSLSSKSRSHHYLIPPNRKRVESCLWCRLRYSAVVLQLWRLTVCWLPVRLSCQLNSRLIWLQIHHWYISLCWVSLMPHIKHWEGHRGKDIKHFTTESWPKYKKKRKKGIKFPPLFSSPWQILYVPTLWKTGVRESKVIKGRHLRKNIWRWNECDWERNREGNICLL